MINYYYSDALTRDAEGNLVKLCDHCAAQHAAVVQFAGPLEEGATQRCERCGSSGCPLALTPQRTLLEQHYRTTCDARDGAAICINTYDQVLLELTATAIDLREQLDQINKQRCALAEHLRQLEGEHCDYMLEAYTLFCQLYS